MTNNVLCFVVILTVMTNDKFGTLNYGPFDSWCAFQLDSIPRDKTNILQPRFLGSYCKIRHLVSCNLFHEVEETRSLTDSTALELG